MAVEALCGSPKIGKNQNSKRSLGPVEIDFKHCLRVNFGVKTRFRMLKYPRNTFNDLPENFDF